MQCCKISCWSDAGQQEIDWQPIAATALANDADCKYLQRAIFPMESETCFFYFSFFLWKVTHVFYFSFFRGKWHICFFTWAFPMESDIYVFYLSFFRGKWHMFVYFSFFHGKWHMFFLLLGTDVGRIYIWKSESCLFVVLIAISNWFDKKRESWIGEIVDLTDQVKIL